MYKILCKLIDEPTSNSKGGNSLYFEADGSRHKALEADVKGYIDHGVSLQVKNAIDLYYTVVLLLV
jgi:hypothetical protein